MALSPGGTAKQVPTSWKKKKRYNKKVIENEHESIYRGLGKKAWNRDKGSSPESVTKRPASGRGGHKECGKKSARETRTREKKSAWETRGRNLAGTLISRPSRTQRGAPVLAVKHEKDASHIAQGKRRERGIIS